MSGTLPSLLSRGSQLASPEVQRETLARLPLARSFEDALSATGLGPLVAQRLDVLQVNVGKLCNQTCRHCHVDAGPDRREVMSRDTLDLCLAAIDRADVRTVDITGGAPELNPDFRWFVEQVRARGAHVIDRCNLTVLETPSGRDLPAFFARHDVEVVCSLPHYRALNTDRQRGDGVFDRSIAALRRLNAEGYGDGHPDRRLVLVTNPVGAFLPGSQSSLEAEWKRALLANHGVRFDALYALANMPISRFLEWLLDSGNLESYMERLVQAYNPEAAQSVMCRTLVSVGWDGTLYDCDFNQMLDLPIAAPAPRHVRDLDRAALEARAIRTGPHCFGCTAGAGSSCGGAATAPPTR
ncbi:MAG: arsenosugar biosynthesis radical SAM (seleno)protein ArsS [Candidatus Eiseniibacteriota bacterium]